MAAFGERVARLIGVERNEVRTAALMFSALFCLISLQTNLKVVRDAAFLSRFGIAQLSYLMLGMAVVTAAALTLYGRVTRDRPRNRVIWALNGVVACTLVGLALGLRSGHRHMPVVLYGWSGIVGLLVLSEFWLLMNELLHVRQAKRLVAVIAAGGVLGGIAGGAISRILPAHRPVPDLLFVAAAELLVAALLCDLASRQLPAQPRTAARATSRPRDALRILRESAYARGIAAIVVCMTVATTLADWQLKAFAQRHFSSQEVEMARFFGIIAVALGVLSFLLQLIGTRRLLRVVGASGCMRALPVSCGIGALFVLSSLVLPIPALVGAAAGSMLIDGVKFSVDRSATELLYTPFASDTRATVMRFVDTVVDRFAGGVAALVWLAMMWTLHVDRRGRLVWVSVVVLGLVAVWLLAVRSLRGGYLAAYRELIGAPATEAPPPVSPRKRRRAARLLARLASDAGKRQRALRAFTSLQAASPPLGLDPRQVEPHIELELDALELLQRVDRALPRWPQPRLRTLHRMVKERIAHACERIVRLLAMLYPPSDLTALHRALRLRSPRLRAAALEFLDALIDLPSKHRLLAALEIVALEEAQADASLTREEGLRALLSIDDARLRACAVWSAVASGVLLDEARHLALTDPSRTVRMAAQLTLATRRRPRVAAAATVAVMVLIAAAARAQSPNVGQLRLELSRHGAAEIVEQPTSPRDPLPDMSDEELDAREAFLDRALATNAHWVRVWHACFTEFYAAGLLVQAGRAAVETDAAERADLAFSAAKAAVGVVGRMAHPPRAVFGPRPVDLYPGDSHAARARRLLAAERMLIFDARENDTRYSLIDHGVNLALNLAGALLVGIGYHDWTRGLSSAGIGFGVGEVSIWLQPWGARRDVRRYASRFGRLGILF